MVTQRPQGTHRWRTFFQHSTCQPMRKIICRSLLRLLQICLCLMIGWALLCHAFLASSLPLLLADIGFSSQLAASAYACLILS